MNTRLLASLAIVAICQISANAQRGSDYKPQINVTGSAEVKVQPDEVDLTVGVESRHETLEGAKKQNDERIAAAFNFLKLNGIKDKDLMTDYISIDPVHMDPDRVGGPIDPATGLPLPIDPATGLPLGKGERLKPPIQAWYYVVRKTIGIRLTDVSKFDTVLGGLVTNGVNHLQGIEFRTSQLRKYKDQAREMAAKAAREKAQAMAASLGVKVGKPINISINDWGGSSSWARGSWGYSGGGGGGGQTQNAFQNVSSDSAETGTTFAVGQISITAHVDVTFSIE